MIITKSLLPVSYFKHLLLSDLQIYLEKEGLKWTKYEELEDKFEFLPDIIVEIDRDKLPIVFVDENIDLKDLFILASMFADFIRRYESDSFYVIPLLVFKKGPDDERLQVIRKVEDLFNMRGKLDVIEYDLDNKKELEIFPNFLEHKIHFRYYAYYLKAKDKGWLE